jgi:hypothetical protein
LFPLIYENPHWSSASTKLLYTKFMRERKKERRKEKRKKERKKEWV